VTSAPIVRGRGGADVLPDIEARPPLVFEEWLNQTKIRQARANEALPKGGSAWAVRGRRASQSGKKSVR
jgi:hypothetical protein